jgi:photosystem II stability/assembly factor-like uncharacterized protein
MRRAVILLSVLLPSQARVQWVTQSSGVNSTLLAVDALDDNNIWVGGTDGTVLHTTNGGAVWIPGTSPEPSARITIVRAIDLQTAFVVAKTGSSYRIWKTVTGGATWVLQHENDSSWCEGIFAFGADTLVAIGGPSQFPGGAWDILWTTDSGNSWSDVDTSRCPVPVWGEWVAPWSTSAFGNSVWFTTSNPLSSTAHVRVFRSTNRGNDWLAAELPAGGHAAGYVAFADELHGLVLLHGSFPGGEVYRTTDGGAGWNDMGIAIGLGYAITAVPAALPLYFAGGHAGWISYTPDNGANWITTQTGRSYDIYSMDAGMSKIWAVGYNGEILRGTINVIVGVDEDGSGTPQEFRLEQNYPNPCNPATTIDYAIPVSVPVVLSVSDVLGRQVSVLVEEVQGPGRHTARFDAAGISSGVYFYRLQAGGYHAVRRMVVVK